MKARYFLIVAAIFFAAALSFGGLSTTVKIEGKETAAVSNPLVKNVGCYDIIDGGGDSGLGGGSKHYEQMAYTYYDDCGGGGGGGGGGCFYSSCSSILNGSCSGGCTSAPSYSCNSGYVMSGSSCVCKYDSCLFSVTNGSCSGGCTSQPVYSCNTGYQLSGTSTCVCKYGLCSSIANGSCTGGCTTSPTYSCNSGYQLLSGNTCGCKYSSCSSVSNGSCSGGCTSEPAYTCYGGYSWNGYSCVSTFSCSSCTNGKKCNASSTACENAPQGDTASCNSGQVATGSGSCVTKATCNSSCGTYSYNTCTLNSIANGQYSASDCKITCNGGYQEEYGACVQVPLSCKPCETFDSYTYSCVMKTVDKGTYNSSCDLTCEPGYYAEGGVCKEMPTTACNSACQKAEGMSCVRDTAKTPAGGNGRFDGSYTCGIICDVGYTLSGSNMCVETICSPGYEKVDGMCVRYFYEHFDKKC